MFSSGCGWHSVCERYCCEHWVHLHSFITRPRPPLGSLPLETIHPHATPAEAWQAINVKLGSGDNETRLYTSIHSKTPAIWRRGLYISSAQQRSRPVHRSDEFAGKRSRGNGFPNSERVRILQPLLPHPKEEWWSKTHSRSQTSESRLYEMAIQDDYIEADPLTNIPRGLVIFDGSERRFISHPDSPHHRRFLRFAFEGVAYKHTVLPFRLSLAPCTFLRSTWIPLRQMGILGLRVNFAKSTLSPTQQISFLGTVIDSAQMWAVVTPMDISKDAGPHGLSLFGTSVGTA